MLLGFALILTAVALCCMLAFRLAVHAVPLFAAFIAGSAVHKSGGGLVAALGAAALAAIFVRALAQLAFGAVQSNKARALIGLAFAVPAGVAGYHLVHGLAAIILPSGWWRCGVPLAGAVVIAVSSWTHWQVRP